MGSQSGRKTFWGIFPLFPGQDRLLYSGEKEGKTEKETGFSGRVYHDHFWEKTYSPPYHSRRLFPSGSRSGCAGLGGSSRWGISKRRCGAGHGLWMWIHWDIDWGKPGRKQNLLCRLKLTRCLYNGKELPAQRSGTL